MAVLLVGCGGALGGQTGTGGTGAEAATSGGAGTGAVLTGEGAGNGGRGGGTAGAGGAELSTTLTLPGCLQDLLAPCAPTGACMVESFGATGITCFETGAHGAWGNTLMQPWACAPGTNVIPVSRGDGTLCYYYEFYADSARGCQFTEHTWKDAAGNIVATGWSGPGGSVDITCSVTGEHAACGVPPAVMGDGCCGVTFFGGATCPNGVISPSCAPGACSTSGPAMSAP